MSKLSDEKLFKLQALNDQGGFWYITKQNLLFRDLCFMAKILEDWGDSKDENYQSFFDSHKTMLKYGQLSSLTPHRATKNCEYIGLTETSDKYSSKKLTPFYFSLKDACNGDFNKLSSYPNVIDKQLERMYIDSQNNKLYTVTFQICPFMFLFKILLLIGDITKFYKISISEFKLFVATAQNWNEYFEVVESIIRYRNDNAYHLQCDKNSSKVEDVRYNVLAQNHSQLNITSSEIAIRESEVKNIRRKVAEYELSDKVQSIADINDAYPFMLFPRQIIYFGAPGTGKSHEIKKLTQEAENEGNVIRTTFHPDSDYSTFVGCYKPEMKPIKQTYIVEGEERRVVDAKGNQVEKEQIIYSFSPQAFTQAYTRAWLNQDKEIYLVIEEINRGNCAQIFGDIFQLLDRDENGLSSYAITPDQDLETYLAKEFANHADANLPDKIRSAQQMQLPSNLHIWATMNTSDQSLFPIDSAFKRRWLWKYIPIADADEKWKIQIGESTYDWWAFIERINTEVETATQSEDKKLGYYFAIAENGIIDADTFVSKVLFYLWNDVFKDSYSHTIFKVGDKDYSFHQFFKANGEVDSDKVNEFLQANKIEPLT